jgi:hypothetical protein
MYLLIPLRLLVLSIKQITVVNSLHSPALLSAIRSKYLLEACCKGKSNFIHNLFLAYFVKLYMFRAYLSPSSGVTTVCIQQLVLIIVFANDCLLSWLVNPTRTTDSHLKRIISTSCCIHTAVPTDDGPRYARNMYSLTKYTRVIQ